MRLYKYSICPQVSEQYKQLFVGRTNVLNELNQLMKTATVLETSQESTLYLHKKRNIVIEVANDRRVILNVRKAPSVDELQKGARMYEVSEHAIDRAIERLGLEELSREKVAKTINDRLQTAVYTGEVAKGRVFDHYASRSRFIVARDADKVITTYSMDTVKGAVDAKTTIGEKVVNLVLREIAKAGAIYRKKQREMTAAASELKIAIAKDEVSILYAKAPHVKAAIQQKLDENTTKLAKINEQLSAAAAEYEALKSEANGIIGGSF